MRYVTGKLNLWKKLGSGSEGKVPMPPLNNFSNFFFSENDFCDF